MFTASTTRDRLGVVAYTILRVVVGAIMAAHGWLKFQDLSAWRQQVESLGIPAPNVLAPLAASSELFGGIFLILGLLTPLAGLFVAGVLATAIVQVHLEHGLMAKNNGFEHPLALLSAALLFVVRGGGPISVDGWLGRLWEKHKRSQQMREGDIPAPLPAHRESRA